MLLYLPANIVSAWAAISSISGTIAAKINGKISYLSYCNSVTICIFIYLRIVLIPLCHKKSIKSFKNHTGPG